MRVRIGNQEYTGEVARFADSWQWWYNHANDLAKAAIKYKDSEEFKLLCKEAAELANLYFSLLPDDAQCQLIVSKRVETINS